MYRRITCVSCLPLGLFPLLRLDERYWLENHFGVGLLGVSNLAEENMLPISAVSMSEGMRAGFYWQR